MCLNTVGMSDDVQLKAFTSGKVKLLLDLLKTTHLEKSFDSRAIVFVQERQIAPALAFLINKAAIPGVRCGYAYGSSFAFGRLPSRGLFVQPGEEKAKLDKTIKDFRLGKINVIVSTAVLEEGSPFKAFESSLTLSPVT